MTLELAFPVIDPKPAMRTIDWAMRYGWNEDGKPYNDFLYPHLSAPGGPFDAFDCSQYFDIWLQFASRLGKTFGGQIAMMKQADCEPCPMLFSSSDEKLATEVVERTYSMIRQCPQLAELLPPRRLQKQSRISLTFSRVYVAWARSVSTLADKSARFIHANEIDKWEHQKTSKEADPLKLADDRVKDFPTFKRWKEATPAQKQTSRIERGRLASCNASFWVPCPLCGRYQTLRKGQEDQPGSLRWDKGDGGRSTKERAQATARYVCFHCSGDIYDEHRGSMMRAGVWVPEGCECNDDEARKAAAGCREPGREMWGGWSESPWITGTPLRDGRDWGAQLSSFYALRRTWGDIASEWVDSHKNPQNRRNFINQWLAETWETVKNKETWEVVGSRIIVRDLSRGTLPTWASLVTVGIDKQGDDRYPWVVDAWGPDRRNATIAYGYAENLGWLAENVIKTAWRHADSGNPVKAAIALVDSGHRPAGVYEFVIAMQAQKFNVLACKGSSTELNADWKRSTLGKDTSLPGMEIFLIDTIRSQLWIDNTLHNTKPDQPGGFSLYNGSLGEHEDFLTQLLNDAAVEELDKSNNARERWERINDSIPNDYRDCKRMAYTGMLIATRGGPINSRRFTSAPPPPEQPSRIRQQKIRGR